MPPRALFLASLFASLCRATSGAAPAAGSATLAISSISAPTGQQVRALLDGGRYADAESLAWRLETAAAARPGADSLEYAQALDLLVEALIRNGHVYHADLRSFADLAVAIRERRLGADRPELLRPLLNLGLLLDKRDDDAAAVPFLQRAVSLCERAPGPDSLELAEALDALGLAGWEVRHAAQPESLVRRAWAIRNRHLPADHVDRAASLASLSIIAWDQGAVKEAVRLLGQAAAMMERTLGPDHPRLARVMKLLALRERFMQNQAGADVHFQRALAIEERSLRANHPDHALTVMWAAANLNDLGEVARAGPMIEQSLAIRERELPPGHPDIAWNLADLGSWHASTGDLAGGRSMLERALAMERRALAPDDLLIGIALRLLAGVVIDLGNYAQGLRLYEESERIYAKHFAEGNPDLFWAHYCVGYARVRAGDLEKGRETLLGLLPEAARIEGPDGRLTSLLLVYLGVADEAQGRWEAARPHYAQALAMMERKRGPGHYEAFYARTNLARAEAALHDWKAARATLLPAIATESADDVPSYYRAYARLLLADITDRMGDRRAALATALTAERLSREVTQENLRWLAEDQALRFLVVAAGGLALVLDLSVRADSSAWRQAYDEVIRSRAMALDEAASRTRLLRGNPDPTVAQLESSLVAVSNRLANLAVRSISPGAGARELRLLRETREERSQIETRLAEHMPASLRESARRPIGLTEVARALPPSAAVVSYACFERTPAFEISAPEYDAPSATKGRGAARYMAFVLNPGAAGLALVPLGLAPPIDSLIARYAAEVSRPLPGDAAEARVRERACLALGANLRRAVWDPVARHLGNAKRVFVVLDGGLHMVNLATLPAAGGGYMVEHGPTLHYLAAERDLVTSSDAAPAGRGLLALGDPDFDAPPRVAVGVRALDQSARSEAAASDEPQSRRGPSVCDGFRGVRFRRLAAAGGEIDTIAAIWSRAAAFAGGVMSPARPGELEPVDPLRVRDAGEAQFKSEAPGHRILHLATHGFFYAGECAEEWPGLRGIGVVAPREAPPGAGVRGGRDRDPEMSPLLLSGLALAGANHRDEAALDRDDGILTAEEIAAMDLTGVQWVVVSACQSGVGAIRDGEGVFGLRRAFQEAGARTTILSLWSVDDVAARE